jgi:diguanylate cyclase (GGDEF)-like protein/PAS domain S-box-containing protein
VRVVTRWFVVTFVCVLAGVGASYLLWQDFAPAAAALVGVGSAAAVVAGVRRYRPRRARAWLFLAAALLLNAAARTVYLLLPGEPGTLKPLIWVTIALHVVMLGFLIAGIRGLATSNVHGRVAVIDAAVILLSTGLLAGTFVALQLASTPGLDRFHSYISVGYVLRDVIIVAVMVNFVTAVRWSASILLLVLGVGGLIANDALFRVSRIDGPWVPTGPLALSWLVFFIAFGAAALVPSMARLDPRPNGEEAAPLRLGLLAAAVLLPFAVLVINAFRRPPIFQPAVATVATLIVILVLIRIIDVAMQLRRQRAGERVLRDASAELAAAMDAPAVLAAVDLAVRRLLRPGMDYRLVGNRTVRPAGGLGADEDGVAHGVDNFEAAGWTLDIALSPQLRPGDGTNGPAPHSRGTPIWEAPDEGSPPTLVVRANRGSLATVQPRLEVLAVQAGLALERMRLNEEVVRHTNDRYFRSLVQNSTDVILVVNDRNRIQYASPSADSIFGMVGLTGASLPELVEHPGRATTEAFLRRVRTTGHGATSATPTAPKAWHDWTIVGTDGRRSEVEISCQDLRDDPSIDGLVVTLRDVTEPRRLERELRYRNAHDPLTGLPNRLSFSDGLEEVLATTPSSGAVTGLLYIDLDDLKMINDGLGHDTGDAVLASVGQLLGNFATTNDGTGRNMAARLGGDEFAVLLADLADGAAADRAAERLVTALGRPINIGGHEVFCHASVGVATTSETTGTATELLRDADLALYAAKDTGKGRWRHFESWMRSTVMARLELRALLERAISDDALILHYQPIVTLEGGRTVGFEALLRWHHPTFGVLAPDRFIDVAEESGLIAPIGRWVLATAMRTAQEWSDGTGFEPYISVNVSARQFRSAGFTSTVRDLLTATGLDPRRLMLEITESLLLRDDDGMWQELDRLRTLGIQIAIDDFGTGYSSLSYLRLVPLDVVKLDRMFVQTMTTTAQQRELVQGIVRLTSGLGLQVIAEGIETDEERALARRAGITYGQGYLFSPPMTEEKTGPWLLAQGSSADPVAMQ